MSLDLKITWDNSLMMGDLGVLTGDLLTDEGLETAVLISLYTDKRASDDDPLLDDRNQDKRGWWGDMVEPFVEGVEIGSRLWLLSREKTSTNIYEKVRRYVDEALHWLLEDGVATKIETKVERQNTPANDTLALEIGIYRTDGRLVALNYSYQWEGS